MYKYNIDTLKQMAEDLANNINPPYTILLQGNLGAGKTTFSQFFIKSILINKNQTITSPTFNIINIYETINGNVWHVDLYRLENKEEIFNLGLLEFMQVGISLVEWPEVIYDYILSSKIKYKIIEL